MRPLHFASAKYTAFNFPNNQHSQLEINESFQLQWTVGPTSNWISQWIQNVYDINLRIKDVNKIRSGIAVPLE